MAITPTPLPATIFAPVATTVPGQPVSQLATLPVQGLVAPTPPAAGTVNFIAATIQQAIASDIAANGPGITTALPAPNNFHFTDLAVNVSGDIPGDAFKGSTVGVTAQFIDLTPDNLLIQATAPNVFMKSDTGNDVMIAASGRNILSAGSGNNTMVGGSGQDTFLADATKANASATILNFGKTDDVAMLGLNLTDFSFSVRDVLGGLEIDAAPTKVPAIAPAPEFPPITAQITLQGFTTADIGSKLSLGLGSTTDGTSFLFVHGN